MTKQSLESQAIWTSVWHHCNISGCNEINARRRQIASALRSLANEVVPYEDHASYESFDSFDRFSRVAKRAKQDQRQATRHKILAIAAEFDSDI
jgi:hypothetical protein